MRRRSSRALRVGACIWLALLVAVTLSGRRDALAAAGYALGPLLLLAAGAWLAEPPREAPIAKPPAFRGVWIGAVAVGLCGLALVRFGRGLDGAFIWDDLRHLSWGVDLVENRSWATLWKYLSENQGSMYRALPSLMAGVDYALWGADSRGWHATTLFFHVGAAFWIYLLGCRLLSDRRAALFAAAALLIYPLATDCALWITLREEGMCLFFYSLSCVLYLRGVPAGEEGARAMRAAAVAATCAALFSKELAVTLPAALWLLGGALGESRRRRLVHLAPHVAAVVLFGWARTVVHGGVVAGLSSAEGESYGSLGGYFASLPAIVAYFFGPFLQMLLIPFERGLGGMIADRALWTEAAIVAALVAALLRPGALPHGHRRAIVALAVLVGVMALPVLPHIAQEGLALSEHRRYYLPAAPLMLLLAALLVAGRSRRAAWVGAGAVLLPYGIFGEGYVEEWVRIGDARRRLEQDLVALVESHPELRTLYFTRDSTSEAAEAAAQYFRWVAPRPLSAVALHPGNRSAWFSSREGDPAPPLDELGGVDWGGAARLVRWRIDRSGVEDCTGALRAALAHQARPRISPAGARRWPALEHWEAAECSAGAARLEGGEWRLGGELACRVQVRMTPVAAADVAAVRVRARASETATLRFHWAIDGRWEDHLLERELPAGAGSVATFRLDDVPIWLMAGKVEAVALSAKPGAQVWLESLDVVLAAGPMVPGKP